MKRRIFVVSCICLALVALIDVNVNLLRITDATESSMTATAYAGPDGNIGKPAPPGPGGDPGASVPYPGPGGDPGRTEGSKKKVLHKPLIIQHERQLNNSFNDNNLRGIQKNPQGDPGVTIDKPETNK